MVWRAFYLTRGDKIPYGDAEIESNTLDAFVRLLRGKLEAAGEARVLRTVRGVGYSLRAESGGEGE